MLNILANLTYLYCCYLRNKSKIFSSYTFMCQSYILSVNRFTTPGVSCMHKEFVRMECEVSDSQKYI